jgi:hypothetical protein
MVLMSRGRLLCLDGCEPTDQRQKGEQTAPS